MNLAKILRILFLTGHLRWMLLLLFRRNLEDDHASSLHDSYNEAFPEKINLVITASNLHTQ